MGFVRITAAVSATTDRGRVAEIDFQVDTGAIYSLVPADQLERLGIKPSGSKTFRQASGRAIKRPVGDARFRIGRDAGVSPVIFGRRGDRPLLGVVTLEMLGLEVDPVLEKLKTAPMLLLASRGMWNSTG